MLLQKIKEALFEPNVFFKLEKKETSYKDVVYYFLVLLGFSFVIGLFVGYLTTTLDIGMTLLTLAVFLVLGSVVFFLILMIQQFVVFWFDGLKGFLATMQAYVYGATPLLILVWVPYANVLGFLYSIFLTVKGLIVLQEMKTWKAVLAYIIPMIVYAGLLMWLLVNII